jgi:hypothetical protein
MFRLLVVSSSPEMDVGVRIDNISMVTLMEVDIYYKVEENVVAISFAVKKTLGGWTGGIPDLLTERS